MEKQNKCKICQITAQQKCSNCQNVFYCSKEHQRKDWNQHKIFCKPIQLVNDEIMGRCITATRPIKAGERILVETPLIWGPSPSSISVCLGCGKAISETTSKPCPKCGWPVCGDLCAKSPAHLPECRYTVQRGQKVSINYFGIPHPTYRCITILRCLYQKQFLSKIWKKLDALESHIDLVKNGIENISICEFIRRFFKLQFIDDEILKIIGIIMINSHEIPITEPPHIAIYDNVSFFEHNCSANCSKSFTNSGAILIKAAKNIALGERLSICYTDSLWTTPVRRQHLYETKFFWCKCFRCSDVTEFGTYFSTFQCPEENCQGKLVPSVSFFNETLPLAQQWKCTHCPKTLSSSQAQDILEEIDNNNEDNKVETSKYLSENSKNMIETYMAEKDTKPLTHLTNENLDLKIESCQKMVQLIKKLAPAEIRNLGCLYFDWHAALAEKADRSKDNLIDFKIYLTQSRNCLLQSIWYLKDEPSLLPEGKIYKQAKKNLRSIDLNLSRF